VTPPVLLRTAYGTEVTVTPEQGYGATYRGGQFGDTRRWVLRPEFDGVIAEVVLSHADLVSLSAQLAALVESER
jgi:hypothetical protein